ncbi:lipopolysaccharide cholinephosphotransferase [Methanobrevibacter gottschalkii]|uniref:Lipopolysaccharide cholinephosphotransferase n=1 Tax=Methanobrevibacter gottschalkii TaxID=190974 RepID=A0A1H7LSB2_9EURY|nr:LicD family protein [Methanobrevibacter gottschalkii]SEL01739.1 lipopolysaccharide cholinephosphotransferase [Methanobrevibacter gottschalkii]
MFKSKRYDDETLKHLQQVQMKIFKYFLEICEEHDLTYFMYAGSLLGTVRHEGFIPWDDDIDVIMFRDDFEKLNNILENNIDKKYRFFNVLNEETYHYSWGRITLKDTLFKEWWGNQVEYTPNIFLDIFILDNVPNNKYKWFVQKWKSFILNQLTIYSIIKYKNESKLKEIIQQSIYYLLKILPISPKTIKKKCVETFSKYQNEDCDRVCDFPSEFFMPVSYKTDWLPVKKAKFEGLDVNIPNNYDKILTMDFNNYMELPPEESRFNTAPKEIDFGEY